MKAEPFLKWPGGKRWLADVLCELRPESYRRYIEPFLGGGAVYFALSPAKALLNDANAELINVYRCVRASHNDIERGLARLQRHHGKDLYYKMRGTIPRTDVSRAIRFLYLNRTCFNGIYRVNRKGEFNVPMGSKTTCTFHEGHLGGVAAALSNATLTVGDFEATLASAGAGDFVYVDPPYTVMHNTNNFIKYNAHLFSWHDQERLADAVRAAASRGAAVAVSNADHASVRDLYQQMGTLWRVHRHTVLAADRERRTRTTELLVTTYR